MATEANELGFTVENWQRRVLETAAYSRPATAAVLTMLSRKLVSEALEVIQPTATEVAAGLRLGRIAVFSPPSHAAYFPGVPFAALRANQLVRKRVAGEFADITWYKVAELAEWGIDMPEVVTTTTERMAPGSGLRVDLNGFNQLASCTAPNTHPWEGSFDENPFVIYGGWYVNRFVRTVSPEYAATECSREARVAAAADLLWATTYSLNEYCGIGLPEALEANYQKLHMRQVSGLPQGEGLGDDRWPAGL